MSGLAEGIRVLHVDDDPAFVDLAAEFLERVDGRLEVITKTTATDAIARLERNRLDCIVSDYDMPDLDGLELLERVRSIDPEFPFILFTGRGSEEIASEAVTMGVSDYLQKETGSDQYTILANRIANAVERYRAVRQTRLTQRAMETAAEGMSLVQPDGTFSYLNPAFATLFGYDRDELVGEHWTVLYDDEEAERLSRDILPAVRETGYWAGETVRLTQAGEAIVTDHRLADTGEDVIVCTARDVTPERAENFQESSAFDLLFDAMDDRAFYTLDHEGYVTRWNEGARRLKGYEPEEILGKHLSVFFTRPDRDRGLPEQLIEDAKAEGVIADEGPRLRQDGSEFWAETVISASYDENGTLRGFGNMVQQTARQPISQ